MLKVLLSTAAISYKLQALSFKRCSLELIAYSLKPNSLQTLEMILTVKIL
jgi:hypothetical protein